MAYFGSLTSFGIVTEILKQTWYSLDVLSRVLLDHSFLQISDNQTLKKPQEFLLFFPFDLIIHGFFSPSIEASLGTLFTVGCLLHIYAFNPLLNFFSFDQMRLLESISKTNQLLQLSCTVLFSNLFHEGARENVQLKPRLTVSTCDLLGVSVFFLPLNS